MNKKDIAVVIPIYLPSLSNSERISLEQCLKLLSSYSIVVIKPESLDLDDIINFFGLTHIEAFPDKHFVSLRAYNKLVLSEEFYRSFQHYTYMLIYQLDAYVFKDELLNWANKGYDYIAICSDGAKGTVFHTNSDSIIVDDKIYWTIEGLMEI